MRVKVLRRFSTVVVCGGSNLLLAGTPGDLLDLEPGVVAALVSDVGDCVEVEQPEPVEIAPVEVEMAPAPIKKARTRQVVKAAARTPAKRKR